MGPTAVTLEVRANQVNWGLDTMIAPRHSPGALPPMLRACLSCHKGHLVFSAVLPCACAEVQHASRTGIGSLPASQRSQL